ncbi:MAG: hypothetical protein MJE77_06960 [Proteobacteria bacterium]|nr:hypothetical protein [Pseudomonadota bacterium]
MPNWRDLRVRYRVTRTFGRVLRPLLPLLRAAAVYFVGFFPLWAALGLATALLWIAGLRSSP